jgi:hypothetical protein
MFKIAVIADPDTESKVPDKTHLWRSFILRGHLYWDGSNQKVDLVWDSEPAEIRCEQFLFYSNFVRKTHFKNRDLGSML